MSNVETDFFFFVAVSTIQKALKAKVILFLPNKGIH